MDVDVSTLVWSLALFYSPWPTTGSDIAVPTRSSVGRVA
jgi:hypothetical protein